MGLTEQAVLRTILYADIFDFPLTTQETWRYLLTSKTDITKRGVEKALVSLSGKHILHHKGGLFALSGKEQTIAKRKANEQFRKEKYELAEKAATILRTIPSVLFIGISGSLAAGSVTKEDDIDFFIISEKKHLWMTRFLSMFLLSKNGMRRTRGDTHEKNKICLNMFLSEDALSFPKARQDVYTAHEIAHLKPLYVKGDIYTLFLKQNEWIFSFLPNTPVKQDITSMTFQKRFWHRFVYLFPMVQLVEFMQRIYMWPHKTTEHVTSSFFAFHPRDYRHEVLNAYKERLKEYNVSEI